jgi:hypothetical protein
MARSPADANQCSSQGATLPAACAPLRNVRHSDSFVVRGSGSTPWRLPRAGCLRKPPLYSDEPVRAIWAATGSNAVGYEVIAAHGTTTAPAAIVAPIRNAGIARDGWDRGASLPCARRTGIFFWSRDLRAGSARRSTAAAPTAPPTANPARNRRRRGADRGCRGNGLGLS